MARNNRSEVMQREYLPVQLTQKEIDDKAKKVVALLGEADEIEEKMKGEAAVHKEALKEIKATATDLRKQVLSGTERRLVEVSEERDLSLGEARTVRLDTGEVVRTRKMSAAELERARQPELFLEEAEAEDARH
jgi:hypothetical protein